MPIRLSLSLITLLLAPFQLSAEIQHLEPPSWWVGMKNPELQLMVHGKGVAGAVPEVDHKGVSVVSSHRMANPNYLYVNLNIAPDASPGTVDVVFRFPDGTAWTHEYPLMARKAGSAERKGFDQSDVMYLLMPDRFANGDPDNDAVDGMLENPDRSEPYGRHGGDLQGIIDNVDYFADMGFTQLWLNPVLENDMPSQSYHGYAATDFYQVDARLGDNELYFELNRKLKEKGIGMIQDMVLNHAGSSHWWMEDLPSEDWINYGGKPKAFTSHRKLTLHDPHGAESDRKLYSDGWFVDTMPDMNQRNPFMATYLIQNSIWWVEAADLSGIRVDTYSYPDKAFLTDWSLAVMDEYPNLNIVGEEWTSNQAMLAYWQAGSNTHDGYVSGLPSVFDFALQENMILALIEEDGWATGIFRLYQTVANDFLYGDPSKLVIFPDNHDMSRIFTRLGEDEDLLRMALAHTFTMRGIPQFFYGTEILMANPGTESHGIIRSDFPGGWAGDKVNAFTGKGLAKNRKAMQDYVRKLLNWRKSAPAIHHGKLTHFVPANRVYVYFRQAEEQTVMVVMNQGADAVDLDTSRFREVIGSFTRGKDVISGKRYPLGTLPVAGKTALVLELN